MSALLDIAPRWHYLGILLACLLCTLPLELLLGARVYRRPVRLALTLLAASGPFLLADWFAVGAGFWTFSPDHVLGIEVLGRLPVEEVLFFVVVPVCGLLTHEAIVAGRWRRLLPARRRPAAATTTGGATTGGATTAGAPSGGVGGVERPGPRRAQPVTTTTGGEG